MKKTIFVMFSAFALILASCSNPADSVYGGVTQPTTQEPTTQEPTVQQPTTQEPAAQEGPINETEVININYQLYFPGFLWLAVFSRII